MSTADTIQEYMQRSTTIKHHPWISHSIDSHKQQKNIVQPLDFMINKQRKKKKTLIHKVGGWLTHKKKTSWAIKRVPNWRFFISRWNQAGTQGFDIEIAKCRRESKLQVGKLTEQKRESFCAESEQSGNMGSIKLTWGRFLISC